MKRIRSKESWRKLISEQLMSGKSQSTWCREHGVALSTFTLWKKRLRGEHFSELPAVIESPPEGSATQSSAKIELPGGAVIHFSW